MTQALFIGCATHQSATIQSVATTNEAAASKAAVRSLLQNQVDAWNGGDLNAFLEAYSDSPDLLFFSNGQLPSGQERWGLGTAVIRRMSGGEWRIVHDHSSFADPAIR